MNNKTKLFPIFLISGALVSPSVVIAADETPWYDPSGWFADDDATETANAGSSTNQFKEYDGDDDVDGRKFSELERKEKKMTTFVIDRNGEREGFRNPTGQDKSQVRSQQYSSNQQRFGNNQMSETDSVWYWDEPDEGKRAGNNQQRFNQDRTLIITNEPIEYSYSGAEGDSTRKGQVTGTIREIESLELGDFKKGEALQVATVELQSGEKVHVSLGQKSNLDKLNLSKGDKVTVKGTTGRITSGKLFIAEEVMAGQKSVAVNQEAMDPKQSNSQRYAQQRDGNNNRYQSTQRNDRSERQYVRSGDNWSPSEQRQNSANEFNSENYQTVSGTIDGFKRVVVDQKGDENIMVKLNLDNGRNAFVNLGELDGMSEVDLQKGDHVVIKGVRESFEGQTIIKASAIKVNSQNKGYESSKASNQNYRQSGNRYYSGSDSDSASHDQSVGNADDESTTNQRWNQDPAKTESWKKENK